MREQLISDLQARIEEDFERWQSAVNTAVQNRKRDDDRFTVSIPCVHVFMLHTCVATVYADAPHTKHLITHIHNTGARPELAGSAAETQDRKERYRGGRPSDGLDDGG